MSIYFGRARKKLGYQLPDLLTIAWLRFRGWTPKLIRQFASEPDQLIHNPRHQHGAPMKFFSKSRIEKIKNSAEFALALAATDRRRSQRGDRSTKGECEFVNPGAIVRKNF